MKKFLIRLLTGLGVAVVLFGGVRLYHAWYDRKVPNFKGTAHLYVYPWMEPAQVQDSILATGAVRRAASVRRAFKHVQTLEPGHYCIDSTCSSMYVARMLHKGWQTPVNLTLSGSIRTPGALARKIGAQMLVDSAEVAHFMACRDSVGVDPKLLFTRIIPDTYQMIWTAPVGDIFGRLFRERDAWWTQERRQAARRQGLTPEEVSVLASIVDGETKYVPEQPAIAAVYLNRLRTGMKLQADPTIAFCFDYQPNRILKSHLSVDSPYNTYKYAGLPPRAHFLPAQDLPGGGPASGLPPVHLLLRRPFLQRKPPFCQYLPGASSERPRFPESPHPTPA